MTLCLFFALDGIVNCICCKYVVFVEFLNSDSKKIVPLWEKVRL